MPNKKNKKRPILNVSFKQIISDETKNEVDEKKDFKLKKIPTFDITIVCDDIVPQLVCNDIKLDDDNPNFENLIEQIYKKIDKLSEYEIYKFFYNGYEIKGNDLKEPILNILNKYYFGDEINDDWEISILAYIKPTSTAISDKLNNLKDYDEEIKKIKKHINKYKSQGAITVILENLLRNFYEEIENLKVDTSIQSLKKLNEKFQGLKDSFIKNYKLNLSTIQLQAAQYRAKNDKKQKSQKLATELNKPKAFEKNKIYLINTPFAPVFMKTLSDGERLIFPFVHKDGIFDNKLAISYDTILNKLNPKFNELISKNCEGAINLAKQIDNYLRQPINSIFNKEEYIYEAGHEMKDPRGQLNTGIFNDRILNIYTGCFCAILLLCESNWKRNPTRGKWERGIIATAIKNMEEKIPNPFENAFSIYIPAQKGGLERGKQVLAGNGNPNDITNTNSLIISESSDSESSDN